MDENSLARQIESYLHEHPEAADTLEGISMWWMRFQPLNESVKIVYAALQELKASGHVVERTGPGGKTLYSLRPDV